MPDEQAAVTPFCALLHFRKGMEHPGPAALIVALISGHFATLLRETARTMLQDHDVYITDWHNARDVPLREGRFGLDEYTGHLMRFLEVIGPGSHLMAICQPSVPALAATALMAEDRNPATPASLTLMAGPVDCRISPTGVNPLATSKPIERFAQNLVSPVPLQCKGAGRDVYPSFLQLTAFLNMNLERHTGMFRQYFDDLVEGNTDRAQSTRKFYKECFAVADPPDGFDLEAAVFQDYDLPRGALTFRDRPVRPAAIRNTALLTVEGGRDDICTLVQTLAAQDPCSNIHPCQRTHYVQAGVGHYGVFSGKRWQQQIYPVVRNVPRGAHHRGEAPPPRLGKVGRE
ncbi:Intracellular polyhydroxyalkanoate depolymerase (fragment) [Thiomonas sp. X19]|uniref:polyhydroxyalkanoate depolymerase n=1 Tax=Thiomonas sp. X19 TaxID=1050370 RepID=UPI000B689F6C